MNGIPTTRKHIPATEQVWPPNASEPQNALGPRLVRRFYGLSLGLALPLAVFTCNGLLGLLVHAVALSGAASLLEQSARRSPRACAAPCKEGLDA
jgi:hypothetical protein